MRTFSLITALSTICVLAFAPGCGDDETSNTTGSGGGSSSSSSSSSGQGGSTGEGGAGGSGGASSSSTGEGGAGGTGGASTGEGGAGGSGGSLIITSCEDVGKSACFTNYDCASAADKCDNVGDPADDIACCVPGTRGAGALGAACTTGNDCKSSLCIDDTICTDTCKKNADCPSSLPKCDSILFSGSAAKFCQPA